MSPGETIDIERKSSSSSSIYDYKIYIRETRKEHRRTRIIPYRNGTLRAEEAKILLYPMVLPETWPEEFTEACLDFARVSLSDHSS